MGEYVDIAGVNTWYDEEGTGEPLVLLHGGLCTNETWAAQMPVFAERFHVVAPERRGHGHTADVPGPLTFADMATDTIGFLDRIVGGPAHLVGWSDGGIVGLLVAIERPDLVRKLVAIGANYDTTGIAPEAEDMAANMAPDSDDMAMFRGLYESTRPTGRSTSLSSSASSRRCCNASRTSPSTPRCSGPSRIRSWPWFPALRMPS